MGDLSRYNTSEKERVLENIQNIKSQESLDNSEGVLFLESVFHFSELEKEGKLKFNLDLIFKINKYFLEPLYSWAGKIRKVNISKDGIMFAPVEHINSSLKEFEEVLKNNIPKEGDSKKEISQKLALLHNEFNVIHPFREGNGRTIRLFLDLIAQNLNLKTIRYGTKNNYIEASQQGIVQNHKPMEKVIYKGLFG